MKTLNIGNHPGKRTLMTLIANQAYYLLPILVLTLLPNPALADSSTVQTEGGHMMGGGYGQEFGSMHGSFGILALILIFGGLIAVIIYAACGLRRIHIGELRRYPKRRRSKS